MGYLVYILRCGDGTLYTGCTNDLPRRLQAHQSGRGAKYTRSPPAGGAGLPGGGARTGLRPCGGRPPSNGWIAGGSWPRSRPSDRGTAEK